MNETIGKILEQDNAQKWHFIGTGVVLTSLVAFLFYIKRDDPNWQLPAQLETMWFGAMTYIAAAYYKAINKAEKLLNKDLDGDGDIGVDNSPVIPDSSTAVKSSVVAEIPKQEVVAYDAECDASTYSLQRKS